MAGTEALEADPPGTPTDVYASRDATDDDYCTDTRNSVPADDDFTDTLNSGSKQIISTADFNNFLQIHI